MRKLKGCGQRRRSTRIRHIALLVGLLLPEAVAEACGEDRKEAGIAEVVVVADFEGSKVLLEAGVQIDGLAAYRRWVVGIAGSPGKGYLETGLTLVVKAKLDRDAEAAAGAWYDIAEAEAETGSDFVEVDAAGAVERVGVAADVVLAGAAGGNDCGGEDAVVVAENELRTEAEASAEGEPVEGCVAGAEVEIDADICALLLKAGGVAEEVSAGAQVELCCERCRNVEAGACQADLRGESQSREWAVGFARAAGSGGESNEGR